MDRFYWDRVAKSYESEIFQVYKQDRKKLIPRLIKKYGAKKKVASDLGCGIGDFLPLLSSTFKHVFAVDISQTCLRQAKKRNADCDNISYMKKDLSFPHTRLPKVDFALSVNAILCPSLPKRARIFDIIARHLRPKSHLVLVTPSIESTLLSYQRYIEWHKRDGEVSKALADMRKNAEVRLAEGIARLQNVPTKFFLREELVVTLKKRKMKVLDIQKIEYPWKTEFQHPPRWMKSPYPWDWLCVAQKK